MVKSCMRGDKIFLYIFPIYFFEGCKKSLFCEGVKNSDLDQEGGSKFLPYSGKSLHPLVEHK